ncbi:dephospho-CoA kinase [Anaerolineales bacterium HSG24]|nr:dephospho-CoA kinase [Anaerolineales bacterium HSG24]
MSGKTIIGITGNIAAGKSMVLRMLQELGATTVDADKLAHQLMRKGTSVHQAIIEEFGKFVVGEGGEINRVRLGRIVFSIPEALERLDQITHPAVRAEVARRVKESKSPVVAVEAVKLFESGLAEDCTSKWLVVAKPDAQLKRLVEKRRMSPDHAKQRIRAQQPPEQKIKLADVIIDNSGELGKTWGLVKKQYTSLGKTKREATQPTKPVKKPAPAPATPSGEIIIRRAKRDDLGTMAELISTGTNGGVSLDISDMMESLFSRAFIVAEMGGQVVGIAAWQTENLVAGLQDFYVLNENMWETVGKKMIDMVHEEVDNLSCEVSLVFILNKAGQPPIKFFEGYDYQQTQSKKLGYIWKDAAKEWQPDDSTLLYKKLRDKRIMVPM